MVAWWTQYYNDSQMELRTLVIFACLLLSHKKLFADIAPANSHYVDRCVVITNTANFPKYVFLGHITGPMVKSMETYVIKPNECLTKGYKFNRLEVYALDKKYFNANGGLKGLKVNDSKALVSDTEIEPYAGYVSNDQKFVKERIEYAIKGLSKTTLMLRQTKVTRS
jgi:hypothetical protein